MHIMYLIAAYANTLNKYIRIFLKSYKYEGYLVSCFLKKTIETFNFFSGNKNIFCILSATKYYNVFL